MGGLSLGLLRRTLTTLIAVDNSGIDRVAIVAANAQTLTPPLCGDCRFVRLSASARIQSGRAAPRDLGITRGNDLL
jgi:hypothetical protein